MSNLARIQELSEFIKEGSGFAFLIDIPRRWMYSENALVNHMEVPFLDGSPSKDEVRTNALQMPMRVGLTAEKVAALYQMSGFSSSFQFTFVNYDDCDTMFDAIFDFLCAFDGFYNATARRPNADTLETIRALDRLAGLLWMEVGFRRICIEGWKWEDKIRRGEGRRSANLSSLANLGLLGDNTAQGSGVTTTDDDHDLSYYSPIDPAVFRERRVRQRSAVVATEEEPKVAVEKPLPKIPDWMLRGTNID